MGVPRPDLARVHYRHSFHAGNFADVLKHAVLCGLLRALNRKPAPWTCVDTHAGAGAYALERPGPGPGREWQEGIGRLAGEAPAADGLLETYLQVVRRAEPGYPGSPLIAQALARPQDRLVLCEQVPEVAAQLKDNLAGDARAVVHVRDGYEAHALLPRAGQRGLVLVDPPFERPDEFDAVAEFLRRALARFAGGIYALWYPVKGRHAADRFGRRVAREAVRPVLALELDHGSPRGGRLRACGMLVVNPPFGFEAEMRAAGAVLARRLGQGPGAAFRASLLTAGPTGRHNREP